MMNGQDPEEVDSFKYIGSTLSKDGTSTKEIKIRIAVAMSVMIRLHINWKSRDINFPTKLKLCRALTLFIYGCESWTLTAETERHVQTFETRCFRRLLCIPQTEHKTNEYVRQQGDSLAGKQEPLSTTVKRRKLCWFGHITRHNTIANNILQGTLEGRRRRGRQRKTG